jgi:hypothetical protein
MGFTFARHACYHCGVNKITTQLTAPSPDEMCCCEHDEEIAILSHNTGEYTFAHDCCSLETEKLITDLVVRAEVQSEIMPFFMVSKIISVIPENNFQTSPSSANYQQLHNGRELTTMHCQILS